MQPPGITRTLQHGAAEALDTLLPELTPDDGGLLDEEQRAYLRRAVLRRHLEKEAEFIIHIVEALATIGDVKALPQIEELAAAPGNTPNTRSVQLAAASAVNRLQAELSRQRDTGRLLRAAVDPGAPDQVLVRPAHGASQEDAGVLLRPTVDEAS
jgi:hypothetical protein